ncbi:MAG: response regulator [Candidatus Omnitrophica bacterium]|nr:response regulator [Candidatus Omnitrophota bacterium]
MQKKTVLLIDDDENFAKLVALNLESTGKYEVCLVSRTSDNFHEVYNVMPDVILLDVVIGEVDGFRFAQDIKANDDLKHIPIIFVTALVKSDEVKEIEKFFGDIPYLIKPVTTDQLVVEIDKY